jgi:hypothetical protein
VIFGRTPPILHELDEYLSYVPLPLMKHLIEDAQEIYQERALSQEALPAAPQSRSESNQKSTNGIYLSAYLPIVIYY